MNFLGHCGSLKSINFYLKLGEVQFGCVFDGFRFDFYFLILEMVGWFLSWVI